MNIGIVIPGFSSDENDPAIPVQLNLVRHLAQTDDVRVLALRYPHRRDRYTVHGAVVYSLGVGAWTRGLRRLALWANALQVLRQLHHEKPFDVLHAMWADETGLIAAWAGRWLGVPVVVSVLGGELVGMNDIDYGLQRSSFSRWTVRQALHGADRVMIACRYVRQLMDNSIPESKISTIVLGIDTTHFCRATSPYEKRRLIHVGSLIGVKDQAMLLYMLARLDNVTLDIIGDGPERGNLQSLALSLQIQDRVNFLGVVAHQDLPAYYQRAALHVLSSRHEGLGMVTLEAAACGVPTVGTDVGLLPDYPSLGLAVPIADDATLAQTISDLLDHPQRYAALRQSAYETVKARFTIQQTATELRALYISLRRQR